jgi:hypothetical protein
MATFDFVDNKFFFYYDFDEELNPNYIKFISKFTSLYFSNYTEIKLAVETNNERIITSDPNYIFTYVGSKFNKPIDGKLLEGLDKIHFGCCFNQTVGNLPKSITELIFGQNFNHPVNNLPEKLFKLELGKKFSQPLDNLPVSLRVLLFDESSEFDHPLDYLPNGLAILKIGHKYNLGLDNLPNSLVALEIFGNFSKSLNNLPDSIEILRLNIKMNMKIAKLPKKLKNIYFGLGFTNSFQINFSSLEDLETIRFNPYCQYNKPIKNLPNSVEKIYLPIKYSKLFNQKSSKLIWIELDKNYKFLDKIKKIYSNDQIHWIK